MGTTLATAKKHFLEVMLSFVVRGNYVYLNCPCEMRGSSCPHKVRVRFSKSKKRPLRKGARTLYEAKKEAEELLLKHIQSEHCENIVLRISSE